MDNRFVVIIMIVVWIKEIKKNLSKIIISFVIFPENKKEKYFIRKWRKKFVSKWDADLLPFLLHSWKGRI